jgi:LmbE family N-acetylglucosaminyl deacetylase
MKGKRIMIAAAHPDDADYYCGGAVAKWVSEGAEVTYLICTDGSLGTSDSKVSKEQISEIRVREQKAANDVLGVRDTIWLGYPDMSLPAGEELRKKIARCFREYKPNILVTFDPWFRYELHPDHTAAGTEAVYARLAAENLHRYPDFIAEGLNPWSIDSLYLMKTDTPNLWIETEDFLEKKADALVCHASQFGNLFQNEKQGLALLKDFFSHRHPETGRIAEGFRFMHLTGIEGLRAYVGI